MCLTRDKPSLLQKVERLLSNEEYPYFYLHPCAETPFVEPHLVYLRITFPLRTDSHYDVCLAAKKMQLAPEFQAKLGWLTTLVFGRVATKDFDPGVRHDTASKHLEATVAWRKDKYLIARARDKGFRGELGALTEEQLAELIHDIDSKDRHETVVDSIVSMANEVWQQDPAGIDKFRSRLLSDNNLKGLCSE
jgi:hypothetical protein